MIAELARRAALEELDDAFAYVESWVRGGQTLVSLCEELKISYHMLNRWCSEQHEDAAARLQRAREAGAHALLEESLQIADDDTNDSKEKVARDKLRIDAREKLAAAWNQSFGPGKSGVTVNIGTLMLEALRQPMQRRVEQLETSPPPAALALAPARIIDQPANSTPDFEVLSADVPAT